MHRLGGAVHLSPADDIFVRIERELDVDTEGQLVASVLSKKIAAGSTHVVIDIPVGQPPRCAAKRPPISSPVASAPSLPVSIWP